MSPVADLRSVEVCHRCLQPVPPKSQRCANCGHRVNSYRGLPIMAGIGGLIALIFVIVIMFQVVRNADIESTPPEAASDSELPQPKPEKNSEQSKPEKPPPLNQ